VPLPRWVAEMLLDELRHRFVVMRDAEQFLRWEIERPRPVSRLTGCCGGCRDGK
jgi:hypothetical protein